jgi:hypothetical protein
MKIAPKQDSVAVWMTPEALTLVEHRTASFVLPNND